MSTGREKWKCNHTIRDLKSDLYIKAQCTPGVFSPNACVFQRQIDTALKTTAIARTNRRKSQWSHYYTVLILLISLQRDSRPRCTTSPPNDAWRTINSTDTSSSCARGRRSRHVASSRRSIRWQVPIRSGVFNVRTR